MNKIMVSGDIDMEVLLELHIISEINEHGMAFFSGVISKETSMKILKKAICEVTISYEFQIGSKLDQKVLFAGQIQKYTVKSENRVYYIEAECLSASIEFDKERKCRSFQNINMTYGQFFHHLAGDGRTIFTTKDNNTKIPHPFIQYEETDWEFLKRMAGYRNSVVVPDIGHMYPQISVGMVQGKTYEYEINNCDIEKNIKEWRVKNGSVSIKCPVSLKIEGTIDMNLCDKILYDHKKFIVLKKEVRFLNGILKCNCWIGIEPLKIIDKYFNNHLCGLRLAGVVETIVGEKIKMKLLIDNGNKEQELYPYTYLPITGNGMYAMPEKGTTVYLYFPNNNEKDAFIIDNLSLGLVKGMTCDYRYMETAEENAMRLLSSKIDLSTKNNEAKIFDKTGIEFFSSKETRLYAKKDIIVRNQGIANLSAKSPVHIENIGSSNDYIHIEGVECTIKTNRFSTSDAGKKVEQGEQSNPKMAWRAAETAKQIVAKIIGAIPSSTAQGIEGKVLGGIPGFGGDMVNKDVSEAAGIRSERTS